jgi:hypothetical protein
MLALGPIMEAAVPRAAERSPSVHPVPAARRLRHGGELRLEHEPEIPRARAA